MDKEKLQVTVILPAHNEELYIKESLSSLINQDYPKSKYEIIVVDNNSTDATVDIAKDLDIRVIHEPNGPVGKVRNTGAKQAKGKLLLFLDSDCIAPKNWISYASNSISSDSKLVLGGGYELRENPKALEKYWLLDGEEGASLPKDLLGGCIAISKAAFSQVGGFDETVTSGEDSKLSETLRQQGFNIVIDRRMSVVHLGNPVNPSAFFRRQIWHSENYIQDSINSIKDPTFYLVLLFTILIPLSLISAPVNGNLSSSAALIAALIPLSFSIKRIKRSKKFTHLKKLHKIYLVDSLYVLGRSLGLLKGTYTAIKSLTKKD